MGMNEIMVNEFIRVIQAGWNFMPYDTGSIIAGGRNLNMTDKFSTLQPDGNNMIVSMKCKACNTAVTGTVQDFMSMRDNKGSYCPHCYGVFDPASMCEMIFKGGGSKPLTDEKYKDMFGKLNYRYDGCAPQNRSIVFLRCDGCDGYIYGDWSKIVEYHKVQGCPSCKIRMDKETDGIKPAYVRMLYILKALGITDKLKFRFSASDIETFVGFNSVANFTCAINASHVLKATPRYIIEMAEKTSYQDHKSYMGCTCISNGNNLLEAEHIDVSETDDIRPEDNEYIEVKLKGDDKKFLDVNVDADEGVVVSTEEVKIDTSYAEEKLDAEDWVEDINDIPVPQDKVSASRPDLVEDEEVVDTQRAAELERLKRYKESAEEIPEVEEKDSEPVEELDIKEGSKIIDRHEEAGKSILDITEEEDDYDAEDINSSEDEIYTETTSDFDTIGDSDILGSDIDSGDDSETDIVATEVKVNLEYNKTEEFNQDTMDEFNKLVEEGLDKIVKDSEITNEDFNDQYDDGEAVSDANFEYVDEPGFKDISNIPEVENLVSHIKAESQDEEMDIFDMLENGLLDDEEEGDILDYDTPITEEIAEGNIFDKVDEALDIHHPIEEEYHVDEYGDDMDLSSDNPFLD